MFCTKCGSTIPDNSTVCPVCSAQIIAQTQQYAPLPQEKSKGLMLWLALSIVSLFCCQPIGMPALLCAIVAIAMANPEQASEKCGKWAKILSLVALGCGLLIGILYFLYFMIMIIAAAASN